MLSYHRYSSYREAREKREARTYTLQSGEVIILCHNCNAKATTTAGLCLRCDD